MNTDINPYDLPPMLYDFVLIPRFDEEIEALADVVDDEDWDYKNSTSEHPKPILGNYIRFTYKRIAEEKKVVFAEDDSAACWNTGLVTPHQEPVYMLCSENRFETRRTYWHFWKFAKPGQWELNRFPKLPEMAHYFDDPSQLVYDTRKELRPNIEHIISDNRDRFPPELAGANDYYMQNIVKGAIDSVVNRVRRNYKTAIPQYYNGNIQLLLPLCLTEPTKADLALVVERFPDFYRASTCLTLDMAYNNARQLARPDRDWLVP